MEWNHPRLRRRPFLQQEQEVKRLPHPSDPVRGVSKQSVLELYLLRRIIIASPRLRPQLERGGVSARNFPRRGWEVYSARPLQEVPSEEARTTSHIGGKLSAGTRGWAECSRMLFHSTGWAGIEEGGGKGFHLGDD